MVTARGRETKRVHERELETYEHIVMTVRYLHLIVSVQNQKKRLYGYMLYSNVKFVAFFISAISLLQLDRLKICQKLYLYCGSTYLFNLTARHFAFSVFP